MDQNYKPKKNKEIWERMSDPDAVLYNPDTASVHIINKTALQIWKLSNGRHSVNDIVKKIRKMFNIPKEHSILQDIEQTLEDFKTNGLIL